MASRKEQKEQARARREAEERARAARERQQRRLRMVIGSVLVAVAIVAVLVAVSSSGGSSSAGLQKGKSSATDRGRRGEAADRHPAVRSDPRVQHGAGDDDLLRGSRVPDLPGLHAQRRLCPAGRQRGPRRQGEDRLQGVRDRHQGSQRLQDPAGRRARRRPAAAILELRRALLPRAGRRGDGLRQRELPVGSGQADPRLQPRQVAERPLLLDAGRRASPPTSRPGPRSASRGRRR